MFKNEHAFRNPELIFSEGVSAKVFVRDFEVEAFEKRRSTLRIRNR